MVQLDELTENISDVSVILGTVSVKGSAPLCSSSCPGHFEDLHPASSCGRVNCDA